MNYPIVSGSARDQYSEYKLDVATTSVAFMPSYLILLKIDEKDPPGRPPNISNFTQPLVLSSNSTLLQVLKCSVVTVN